MAGRFDRDWMRGGLDLMVLAALGEGPLYGYLIQKRIRELSAQRVRLDAGTLYPLLHRLESSRWVRSRWDDESGRKRKWYELTAAGKRQLLKQTGQWRQFSDCLNRMLDDEEDSAPQPA